MDSRLERSSNMVGGGMYEVTTCPSCGELLWNGYCENKECKYHFYPYDENENENDED